jgi:hypothetical protein
MENESTIIIKSEKPEVQKFDNELRPLKYKNEVKFDALNLKPENLKDLAEFLNSIQGQHINKVFFCEDGNYYFRALELNGKFYTRFNERKLYNNDTQELETTEYTLVPKTEIVMTKSADWIIDEYFNWKFAQEAKAESENKLLEDAKFQVAFDKRKQDASIAG